MVSIKQLGCNTIYKGFPYPLSHNNHDLGEFPFLHNSTYLHTCFHNINGIIAEHRGSTGNGTKAANNWLRYMLVPISTLKEPYTVWNKASYNNAMYKRNNCMFIHSFCPHCLSSGRKVNSPCTSL